MTIRLRQKRRVPYKKGAGWSVYMVAKSPCTAMIALAINYWYISLRRKQIFRDRYEFFAEDACVNFAYNSFRASTNSTNKIILYHSCACANFVTAWIFLLLIYSSKRDKWPMSQPTMSCTLPSVLCAAINILPKYNRFPSSIFPSGPA